MRIRSLIPFRHKRGPSEVFLAVTGATYRHATKKELEPAYMNNANSLLGKRALIIGGSRGIGAAIARKLASDGPMADQILNLIPLGRYSEPDDIAAMVAYLAGPDARQITGAAFTVDGGTNT